MPAPIAAFKVSPERLLDQARASLALLRAPENADLRADLSAVGLEGVRFTFELEDAVLALATARADQLQLSSTLDEEREQDRRLAEEGFRWLSRLHARARFAAAGGADPEGAFPQRLGYRALPRARGAGVEAELHRVLPELESLAAQLAEHGLDDGFVEEGRSLGRALRRARDRTATVADRRKSATAEVRRAEGAVVTALRRLVAADEATCLERPGRRRAFPLALLLPGR